MVHTFGRSSGHPEYIWDNQVFTQSSSFNDVIITHEGELSMPYYFGFHHGSQIIPLKSNGKFNAVLGNGKNGTDVHFVVLRVYGYILRKSCHLRALFSVSSTHPIT
ncbi:MAG: hypothetical protein ACK56I_21925, partial [bacterium]